MTRIISAGEITPANGWTVGSRWPWKNERIAEMIITEEMKDAQGETLKIDAFVEQMPLFLERGIVSVNHTNQNRGVPLAWKMTVGDHGRPAIALAVGIHQDTPQDDAVWESIKECGDSCGVSVGGDILARQGKTVLDLALYEISWLTPGVKPSNPGAHVTATTLAKGGDALAKHAAKSVTPLLPMVQERLPQSGDVAKCPACGQEIPDEAAKSPPSPSAPAPQASASKQEPIPMTEKSAEVPPATVDELRAGLAKFEKCRTEFEAAIKTMQADIVSLKATKAELQKDDLMTMIAKRLESIEARLAPAVPGKPMLQKSAPSEVDADGKPLVPAPKDEVTQMLNTLLGVKS